jgi:hypothetical protein
MRETGNVMRSIGKLMREQTARQGHQAVRLVIRTSNSRN